MQGVANGTFDQALIFFPDTYIELRCEIGKLDFGVSNEWFGLVYPKNWPFKDLFNHYLIKVAWESGVARRSMALSTNKKDLCKESKPRTDFEKVTPLCGILVLGWLLALVLLIVELGYQKWNSYAKDRCEKIDF